MEQYGFSDRLGTNPTFLWLGSDSFTTYVAVDTCEYVELRYTVLHADEGVVILFYHVDTTPESDGQTDGNAIANTARSIGARCKNMIPKWDKMC